MDLPRSNAPALSGAALGAAIADLEKEFGGTERLVDALRYAPGFQKFNRTTVYRWKKAMEVNASVDFKKATRAVQFLRSQKHDLTLTLALPETLQVLPAMLLLWDDVTRENEWPVKKDAPYGLLRRRGVKATVDWCKGGQTALGLLYGKKRECDVAFAADEFGTEAADDSEVQRLCQVTVAEWAGVGRKGWSGSGFSDRKDNRKIYHLVSELEGKRVGYNPETAMPHKLEQIEREFGIKVKKFASTDAEKLAHALAGASGERIDVVLGWEPTLSEIMAKLGSIKVKVEPIQFIPSDRVRYAVKVFLFARKSTQPTAVRLFLDTLDEANSYVSENWKEIVEVCKRKQPEWHLEYMLERQNIKYGISDLSSDLVRHFWRSEISNAQPKAK
jgi:hypothetical protein